jgi:hypothetical protein
MHCAAMSFEKKVRIYLKRGHSARFSLWQQTYAEGSPTCGHLRRQLSHLNQISSDPLKPNSHTSSTACTYEDRSGMIAPNRDQKGCKARFLAIRPGDARGTAPTSVDAWG